LTLQENPLEKHLAKVAVKINANAKNNLFLKLRPG
jgi:hypothetical protein